MFSLDAAEHSQKYQFIFLLLTEVNHSMQEIAFTPMVISGRQFRNNHCIYHYHCFFDLSFLSLHIDEWQDCRGRGRPFLTPLYHFHPLHRNSEISRAITSGISPLDIASGLTPEKDFWFLSNSGLPLRYTPNYYNKESHNLLTVCFSECY